MKLTRIKISNYKKLDIDIDSKTTKRYIEDDLNTKNFIEVGDNLYYPTIFSITGANGSGKSSIIEIFEFLRIFTIFKFKNPKQLQAFIANSPSFSDYMSLLQVSQFDVYDLTNKSIKILNPSLKNEDTWAEHCRKIFLIESNKLYTKAFSSTKPILISFTLISNIKEFTVDIQIFMNEYRLFVNGKIVNEFNSDILDFISNIVIFSQMSYTRRTDDFHGIFTTAELTKVTTDIHRILAVRSKESLLSLLQIFDKNIIGINISKNSSLTFGIEGKKLPISVTDLSQGTKVMIQYVSSIFNTPKGKGFFVADEIENHLNSRLVDMIKSFIMENGAQLLYTSHSPLITSSKVPAKQIFVLKDKFDTEYEAVCTTSTKLSTIISPNNDPETQLKKGTLTSPPSYNEIMLLVNSLINGNEVGE